MNSKMNPDIHPELLRRIQMGQLHHGQRVAPDKRPSVDRTGLNPLPPTKEGAAILRQLHNCPMATLTKQLDGALRQALDRTDLPEVERLTPGTHSCIVVDLQCAQSLNTRPMVRFQDDEELLAMTQQLEVIALEATALQSQLQNLEQSYNHLEHERFQKAAVKYGLNIKDCSYRVNEKEGCIESIEPKCSECVPIKKLQDILRPKEVSK